MKIKRIGNNITEIHLDSLVLLISYDTPVAWACDDVDILYITDTKYSSTTSKHINKFQEERRDHLIEKVPQQEINTLYKNILQGRTPTEFYILNKDKKDRFDDLII